MPILEIEITGPLPDPEDALASRLAEAAGQALDSREGGTWIKLRHLPASAYAENGGGPPTGVQPVFVSIMRHTRPEGEALQAEITRLTEAIAGVCGRPSDQVHLIYAPDGAGRVAFGGRLV